MAPNLAAAWIGMLAGCVAGALPGLFFDREAWLGGYASWRRRMIRLAHIAFFGIGIINLGFHLTVTAQGLSGTPVAVARGVSYNLDQMTSAFGLLLAASMGWCPQGDSVRDLAPVVAVVLEMAELDAAVPVTPPAPAAPSVCDVRHYYDDFAPQLAEAPHVEPVSLITYSTDLPIFRDKA